MNRDFSKIIINCSSANMSLKDFRSCIAVYNEQTFGGLVVDASLLDEADSAKKKKNYKMYCSCNFPFTGFTSDMVINSMVYLKTLRTKSNLSGFFTSVPKIHVQSNNWKAVRSFVAEINEVVYEDIYLSIEPTWCNNPEDLAKMFSILSGYEKIHPMVSIKGSILDKFEKNINLISELFKSSTVSNINVFLPPSADIEVVIKCIDLELGYVIISPSTALEISREI